jgi:hypothetical protein
MIPRRVKLAIFIAFLLHGFFILTTRYRLSYDAYTHMLFANHYAENWFSLWETRWYTGFTVVSYPPLIHQLTAMFVPIFGLDAAFAFMLWVVTTLYPLGTYTFSRIFIGKSAASYAALAAALLLPIYVVAHIFGQLPFLASTLITLFGAASLHHYLREGGVHNMLLTVSLLTMTMAAHHATLLVQPFLIFAVVINHVNNKNLHVSMSYHPNLGLWFTFILRMVLFTVLGAIASIIVIWPFWEWGMHQTMQTPIDHPSRHNFFEDPLAHAIFFWPLYGPLVVIFPFLFQKWPLRFWGLIAAFIVLLLLGLGGTTSLPRLFFGDAWEWLTYDRFAFWACLTLTPFFGIFFIHLKSRWRSRFRGGLLPVSFYANIFSALTFSIFALTAVGAWLTPLLFPIQPEPIDMKPVVDFLNNGDHSQWRYLTFGFGDQFAYLNLLTKATTIDGSYHTARTLPELRESGIGQVDTVYWALKGVPAIKPILKDSGQHGVRWGFVNPDILLAVPARWGVIHHNPFVPILKDLGWVKVRTLNNRIQVWENPQATLPKLSSPPAAPSLTSFSWGVFPMLAFVSTTAFGFLRIWHIKAQRVLRGLHAFVVGLIPLSLCFWYYRTIAEFPHGRAYFIYTDAIFFLSDALVLLAVILWISTRVANMSLRGATLAAPQRSNLRLNGVINPTTSLKASLNNFLHPLLALIVLSSLSILWATDWRTSLYIALHLWLIFFFVLSLIDWRDAWRPAMFGFCAALSIQFISSIVEFAAQSTTFLKPLQLTWPGPFDPSIRGVSVVQFADGLRVLRAYGTMAHPNILGGFVLISLLGPISLFLANKKPNYLAMILLSWGIIILGLSFSRSAWLALIVFIIFLILKSKYLNRRQLYLLIAVSLVAIVLTLYPLRDLVLTRVSNSSIETEQLSIRGRSWLNQQGLEIMRQHPLTGVGIGAFIITLANYALEGAPIEPVHNILLLAGAELGVMGVILLILLFTSIGVSVIKAKTPKSIMASALVIGLGLISFFDHYLWSLPPGRLMLGLALGLWAGTMDDNAA